MHSFNNFCHQWNLFLLVPPPLIQFLLTRTKWNWEQQGCLIKKFTDQICKDSLHRTAGYINFMLSLSVQWGTTSGVHKLCLRNSRSCDYLECIGYQWVTEETGNLGKKEHIWAAYAQLRFSIFCLKHTDHRQQQRRISYNPNEFKE